MSRRPEGLTLDDELMVRKGQARAVGPAAAVPTERAEPPPAAPKPPPWQRPPLRAREPRVTPQEDSPDDLSLIIGKRQTVERVFTNVRTPVDLDERLFRMMVATRRNKIETFIRDGLERYEAELRRAGRRAS